MKLITKEIEKKLPKIYETDGIPVEEKTVIVKFFCPWSSWTWYAVEGNKLENGDWEFFGLVEGFEKEWGYFNLSELESIRGVAGLRIERDRHFGNPKIKEI